MNKDQEDTLNMYQAADSELTTNNGVWALNLPFAAAVAQLEANIDAIENVRDQQDADITGITEDKQNRRQKLEDETFTIGSVIVMYASTVNNRELLKKVNFTRSELLRARDNELPGMSDRVHQAAADNTAAVLPFGITAIMITALQTAIDAFVDYISKPRAALSETSAATEQLPPLFTATNKLLEEQLDRGMELYRVLHNDFYKAYFNSRIIVNSPTQKRALEVQFVELTSGMPIGHVNVKVDTNITRRSSEMGNIRVQDLTEGSHSLTATLPGYTDGSATFNVISGETTKLIVKMHKLPEPS
jgi:hypothetical protein